MIMGQKHPRPETSGQPAPPVFELIEVEQVFPVPKPGRGLFSRDTVGLRALDGVRLRVPQGASLALVGESGSGKSTLLKLMTQEIEPQVGEVRKNPHLRIGRYNQHSEDVLDLEKTPLDFVQGHL